MINSIVRSYSSWKRYRRTYDELANLSNRELDDLGIARADISKYARTTGK